MKTGAGADLAFAVVLMAAYFATFSSIHTASTVEIVLLIVLGITYISLGIYGYGYVARSDKFWLHLLYFAIQIPLGGWIVSLAKSSGLNALILLPLAGQSVMLLPRRWMLVSNFLIMSTYVIAAISFTNGFTEAFNALPTFLAGQVFVAVFTQMALNEEKARQEVERLVAELAEANQRLREYAVQAEELAITRERNRLAREIHDGLGHYLTTIHMQIKAARATFKKSPQRSEEILVTAQNLTQEALEDVRASVASLRALPEDSLPLPVRVEKIIDWVAQGCSRPALEILGQPRNLSPQADLTLYRAAQEGLNNACKHAQAEHIRLRLDYSAPKRVCLTIEDDGIGADKMEGGFGLIGLKERVNLLDGDFRIVSSVGKGFTLEIGVPG